MFEVEEVEEVEIKLNFDLQESTEVKYEKNDIENEEENEESDYLEEIESEVEDSEEIDTDSDKENSNYNDYIIEIDEAEKKKQEESKLRQRVSENYRLKKLPQRTLIDYLKHHIINEEMKENLKNQFKTEISSFSKQIVNEITSVEVKHDLENYFKYIKDYQTDADTLTESSIKLLTPHLPENSTISVLKILDEKEIFGWEEEIKYYIAELNSNSSIVSETPEDKTDRISLKENRKTVLFPCVNFNRANLSLLMKMVKLFAHKHPHEKRFDIRVFTFTSSDEVAKISERMGFQVHYFLK